MCASVRCAPTKGMGREVVKERRCWWRLDGGWMRTWARGGLEGEPEWHACLDFALAFGEERGCGWRCAEQVVWEDNKPLMLDTDFVWKSVQAQEDRNQVAASRDAHMDAYAAAIGAVPPEAMNAEGVPDAATDETQAADMTVDKSGAGAKRGLEDIVDTENEADLELWCVNTSIVSGCKGGGEARGSVVVFAVLSRVLDGGTRGDSRWPGPLLTAGGGMKGVEKG